MNVIGKVDEFIDPDQNNICKYNIIKLMKNIADEFINSEFCEIEEIDVIIYTKTMDELNTQITKICIKKDIFNPDIKYNLEQYIELSKIADAFLRNKIDSLDITIHPFFNIMNDIGCI
jgi:uncharacterized protein YihD (DUF1040 family)